MKIIAISDLHGQLPEIKESAECLFICGDIVPLDIQTDMPMSLQWLTDTFIPWCLNIDVDEIFLIAGNHDFVFERNENGIRKLLSKHGHIHYLHNETYDYMSNDGEIWKIFGTPDCHQFGNWAFMRSPEKELADFNKMPDDADIVLSHDACYGRNDVCDGIYWSNQIKHIGNPELLQVIKKKKPRYQFTGHLHTSDHTLVDYDGTRTACVSLLDERYEMTYKPLILDIYK